MPRLTLFTVASGWIFGNGELATAIRNPFDALRANSLAKQSLADAGRLYPNSGMTALAKRLVARKIGATDALILKYFSKMPRQGNLNKLLNSYLHSNIVLVEQGSPQPKSAVLQLSTKLSYLSICKNQRSLMSNNRLVCFTNPCVWLGVSVDILCSVLLP